MYKIKTHSPIIENSLFFYYCSRQPNYINAERYYEIDQLNSGYPRNTSTPS